MRKKKQMPLIYPMTAHTQRQKLKIISGINDERVSFLIRVCKICKRVKILLALLI